jgi:N-acetylglucosaminyldiphosphoundecaprenol N-acetyl-beta-D-mannosaminyltransferase
VAERTARLLESKFPGVRIVGTCAPDAASLSQIERSGILQMIHQARPDVLLVALGNPKQEKWTWTHRKQLQVPVAIGVGGSFDILVGDMQRAPRWLQQCGLEWAMRTVQEPLRLIPRYVRDLFGLARSVPLAVLAAWLQRPYRGPSQVTMAAAPKLLHVHVQGGLCAERAEAMAEATKSCIENGLTMVVHLEAARQTTVAGFGVLLDARRELLEAGLSLALAGLRWKTRFALYAWRLRALFDEWQPAVSRGHSLSVERPANLATGGEQARTRFHSEQEKPAA